jgi:hypothetical protein
MSTLTQHCLVALHTSLSGLIGRLVCYFYQGQQMEGNQFQIPQNLQVNECTIIVYDNPLMWKEKTTTLSKAEQERKQRESDAGGIEYVYIIYEHIDTVNSIIKSLASKIVSYKIVE